MKFKVCWCRKSRLGAKYPFNLLRPSEWGKSDVAVCERELGEFKDFFRVSPSEWDTIAGTLLPLDSLVMREARVFIVTDGVRGLAVDTQGYPYPRYKSLILPAQLRQALRGIK